MSSVRHAWPQEVQHLRVLELGSRRRSAVAEADAVRGDHVEAILELRNQVTKHVRGRRETVQQHDDWRALSASLAVENV